MHRLAQRNVYIQIDACITNLTCVFAAISATFFFFFLSLSNMRNFANGRIECGLKQTHLVFPLILSISLSSNTMGDIISHSILQSFLQKSTIMSYYEDLVSIPPIPCGWHGADAMLRLAARHEMGYCV